MNTFSAKERHTEEATSEPLSHLAKHQAAQEATLAAARKGGAMVIHGRELQTKGLLSDERSSVYLEGMLMKISDQTTRRAQILSYQKAGLTPHEIIKVIWHVQDTDSSEYRMAYEECLEVMHADETKHS